MKYFTVFYSFVIITVLILCSCTSKSPVTFDSEQAISNIFINTVDISMPLGIYTASIDYESGDYELTPIRKSSGTDVLEIVDLTNFLSLAPCINCVIIRSIGIDNNSNLVVEIGIRHPFEPGNIQMPPSGKNRADLHVFNVEGIVFSSNETLHFGEINESISTTRLLNADGFTGYLNNFIDSFFPTNATIHPYKLHFDDYSSGNFHPANNFGFGSVTVPGPSGKLVMPMGSEYDFQNYIFDVSQSPLEFVFAVGCTYPLAAESVIERFYPVYRIPQFNKKAASEISCEIVRSNLQSGDTSSSADIRLEIVDINHGVATGNDLDKMLADSSVREIHIEIPGLLSDTHVINGSENLSGSGHSPDDPLVYIATVTNELGADLGSFPALIKVIDNYPPNLNQNLGLNQKDGISRVPPGTTPLDGLFEIDEFATWQYFEITVGEIIENPIWTTVQGDIANTGRIGYNGPQNIHNAPTWTATYPPGWNFYGNPLPPFYNETTLFVCTTGDGGPLPAYAIDLETKQMKWSQQFHNDMQNWLNIKCLNADGSIVLTVETKYDRMVALDAENGDFLWDLPGMIRVDSYPTLDLDGNFIVPLQNVGIQSISPSDGSVNWTANVGDTYYNTPAVGSNGTIYTVVGGQGDGNLRAINSSNGNVKWQTESIGQLRGQAVTVHPNQTIIAWGTNGMFCFQDDGDSHTTLWVQPYECPFYGGVGIGMNDDIYALGYDTVLRRIDPSDGSTIASTSGWGYGNSSRPAIGADGLIYVRTYLYDENMAFMSCFNPDTTLRWQHHAGAWFGGTGHYASPAIGMDGSLYSCYRPWGACGWNDEI